LDGAHGFLVAWLAVRIFSGIQPTGTKHLGNYIGAIRQYVTGQDRGEALYCVVDLHAITLAYDPAELRRSLYDLTALLLAAGLDPERCILFRQGDVPEHSELCWLLCSVTELGRLQRMHQFRDKSQLQRELVSAGLLVYPVLQAADVLAYRAHEVPVGEDQREHLELRRDVARRFNTRFGKGKEVLVVPEHRIPAIGARIMDLQEPTRKMSTTGGSEHGTVYVLDEPSAILKKFKSAVTDSGREIERSPEKPGVSNLIEILAVAQGVSPEQVEADMRDGTRALRRAARRRAGARGGARRRRRACPRDSGRHARRGAREHGRWPAARCLSRALGTEGVGLRVFSSVLTRCGSERRGRSVR
jgi:tryptophanyl-tRNA synthetase